MLVDRNWLARPLAHDTDLLAADRSDALIRELTAARHAVKAALKSGSAEELALAYDVPAGTSRAFRDC